jgi:polyhydroxybutyrate depolymerase
MTLRTSLFCLVVATGCGGGSDPMADATSRDVVGPGVDRPEPATDAERDARPGVDVPDVPVAPDGGGSPSRSAGCGMAGAATGSLARTATIAGTNRTYTLVVPTSYQPAVPRALVFVFHGAGGNAGSAMGMGLQDTPGAADGAIFVFPDGIPFESFGVGWDQHCTGRDMPFYDAMVQAVESRYCVDTRRRFVAGFSWGADMSDALACCRGDQIRAIAPASGDEVSYNPTCPGAVRPAFRLTYGDNDGAYTQQQFRDSVDFFRAAHGCSTSSDAVTPSPCVAYRGCAKPVIECRYAGIGHSWPSTWARDTWTFFSSFP